MTPRLLIPCCLFLAACSQQPTPEVVAEAAPTASPVVAAPEAKPEEDSEQLRKARMDTCGEYAKLANTIMSARQNGVAMRKLMETIAADEGAETTRRMIVMAYEAPGYSTDVHQQREIVDFENTVYAECLRANDLP